MCVHFTVRSQKLSKCCMYYFESILSHQKLYVVLWDVQYLWMQSEISKTNLALRTAAIKPS